MPYTPYDAWITLDKADAGMKAVPPSAPANTGLDLKAFQNLGYTGEWFVFAGFVVFMWFRLLRREVEFVRDAELGLLPDPQETSGTPETPATPVAPVTPVTPVTPGNGAEEAGVTAVKPSTRA